MITVILYTTIGLINLRINVNFNAEENDILCQTDFLNTFHRFTVLKELVLPVNMIKSLIYILFVLLHVQWLIFVESCY